jgi:hypothetical protein
VFRKKSIYHQVDVMMIFNKILIMHRFARTIAPFSLFRSGFAIAFILLSALQPGLFAVANAAGMHGDPGTERSMAEHADHHAGSDHHAYNTHVDTDRSIDDHNGALNGDQTSCEVHCAPAHAVPVDDQALPRPFGGSFDTCLETSLSYGLALEFTRPPRS